MLLISVAQPRINENLSNSGHLKFSCLPRGVSGLAPFSQATCYYSQTERVLQSSTIILAEQGITVMYKTVRNI